MLLLLNGVQEQSHLYISLNWDVQAEYMGSENTSLLWLNSQNRSITDKIDFEVWAWALRKTRWLNISVWALDLISSLRKMCLLDEKLRAFCHTASRSTYRLPCVFPFYVKLFDSTSIYFHLKYRYVYNTCSYPCRILRCQSQTSWIDWLACRQAFISRYRGGKPPVRSRSIYETRDGLSQLTFISLGWSGTNPSAWWTQMMRRSQSCSALTMLPECPPGFVDKVTGVSARNPCFTELIDYWCQFQRMFVQCPCKVLSKAQLPSTNRLNASAG